MGRRRRPAESVGHLARRPSDMTFASVWWIGEGVRRVPAHVPPLATARCAPLSALPQPLNGRNGGSP